MSRVLVIDDEHDVRLPILQVLAKAGYEVEEAPDGHEGVERYRENPADLVIVDIFMPTKSGLEVIQELKRDFPSIKIIAISGVDVRDGLDLATLTRAYEVDRAIEKPFHIHDLLQAVRDLLTAG
ncbi:MAG: response regulator [Candidatus Latescibacteria bacterium]|nr:response regulator [Candidatus Latescibacterota bacterium]